MSRLVSGGKKRTYEETGGDRNAARVFEAGAQTVPVNIAKDKIIAACARPGRGWLAKLSVAGHNIREAVPVFAKRHATTTGLAEIYQAMNQFELEAAGEAFKDDKFMVNTIFKNTYVWMGIPVENAEIESGVNEPQVTIGVAGIVTTQVVTASPGGRAVGDFPLVAATSSTPSTESNFGGGRVTMVIREADEDLMAYRVLRAHAVILQNPQIWAQAQNDYYSPHPTLNAARQQQSAWSAAGLSSVDYWLRKGVIMIVGAKGPVPNLDDARLDGIRPDELLGGNVDGLGLQDSLPSHEIVARMAELSGMTVPADGISYMVSNDGLGRYKLYQYCLAQQMLYGSLQPYKSLEEAAQEEMPDMSAYEGENSYFEFGRTFGVGGGLEFAGRFVDSNTVSNNRTGSFLKLLMNAARRSLSSYAHAVEEDWLWTVGTFMTGSDPSQSGNAIISMTR